jgi:uncharacterized protein YabE (DUF348 family)
MAEFKVNVNVQREANIGEHTVLYINIDPETVPLDGKRDNTIVWTTVSELAEFVSPEDIQFRTNGGKSRFNVTFNQETKQITATINGDEEDQTIYTYFLTVHLPSLNAAIRIDPEVDNPPPPPG